MIRSHVAGICDFFKCSKKKKKKDHKTNLLSKKSQSRRKCLEPVSNLSQFSFRESERARYVTQICERLSTYETKLRLIGDKNENLTFRARVPRVCRTTIARYSRYMCANSRRTLLMFTAILVQHTQMCRKVPIQCDSK